MKLIEFDEQTVVIAKDQPEYLPLPAHRFSDVPHQGRIAFCWQLDWRERIKALLTGKLWHQVLTFNQPLQPQLLTTDKPEMRPVGRANEEITQEDWKSNPGPMPPHTEP